jgi:methylated-DNA-[protein]-cysteine S-methyltransferase
MLKYTAIPGLHGSVGIVACPQGLRKVILTGRDVDETCRRLAREYPEARRDDGLLASFRRQLRAYFAGEPVRFTVRVDLAGLTDFQKRVLAVCAEVGYGQTITYGELARRIGKPRAGRAVGAALGRNPVPLAIPCHRVVGCNGGLGGFSAEQGIRMKRRLLELESGDRKHGGDKTRRWLDES